MMAHKRTLLVEGKDDKLVLLKLCENRGGQQLNDEEIIIHGGVQKLLESFQTRLKESDVEALGVVIDADTDLAARWQALRDRLANAGYQSIPERPDPTGTILSPPANALLPRVGAGTILSPPANALLPRVGIWIMPDNQTKGILEDFLRFLVPAESPLFDHVESSVKSIPEGERRFGQLAEPKAIIHTWLAWQKDPGAPFGTAITARFLDPDVAQVDILVSWLKRLFFP